jgi:hypothetical protein
LFKELLGIQGIKPFECVGTNEEVVLAMRKYSLTPAENYSPDPSKNRGEMKAGRYPILQMFEREILTKMSPLEFEELEKKLMTVSKPPVLMDGDYLTPTLSTS